MNTKGAVILEDESLFKSDFVSSYVQKKVAAKTHHINTSVHHANKCYQKEQKLLQLGVFQSRHHESLQISKSHCCSAIEFLEYPMDVT